MANITLDGLPLKTGTISDAGILHLRESGVDKKVTITAFLAKIAAQYNSVVQTFLASTSKAEMRASMDIARRTAVSNADYTILTTDKIVANITTLTAARTFTLPAASAYPAGEELVIADQSFSANTEFKITISRAGSDTFDDGSTSVVIDQKGGIARLVSDGTSKWTILLIGNPFAPKLYKNRNVLRNGDFLLWNRNGGATSFTSIASDTVFAHGWRYRKSGAMVHDVSRSTDVPTVAQAGRKIPYSVKIDCTTVDSSIAAGDYCFITQRVEGYKFAQMIAQKKSIGHFWVKAPKTGVFCISHNNSGNDRGYVSEYTINSANTWERKTIVVEASPSGGTWDYTNGIGIDFNVVLAAGSTYHTTAGAWQTGVFLATSNQVNACDNTSNDFYITEIQWEEGGTATPFDAKDYDEVVQESLRFYRTNNVGVNAICINTTTLAVHGTWNIPMRAAPSVSLISGVNPTLEEPGVLNRTGSGSAIVSSGTNTDGFYFGLNGFTTMNGQRPAYMTNVFAQFDAEL